MKLVQWVWLCMTSFFLISYQSIRFKFFLFSSGRKKKTKMGKSIKIPVDFHGFSPSHLLNCYYHHYLKLLLWVGWITNTPKILSDGEAEDSATHMVEAWYKKFFLIKAIKMLMVWIIGLLAIEPHFILFCWLYLRKMQRKTIDNNFSV